MNTALTERQLEVVGKANKLIQASNESHFQSDTRMFCEDALACAALAVELAEIVTAKSGDAGESGSIPKHIADALEFSRCYANASPYLNKTGKMHIEGLADLLEAAYQKDGAVNLRIFDPARLPAACADGYFTHPDVPREEDSDLIVEILSAIGWDCEFVSADEPSLEDGHHEAFDVTRWQPEMPRGDGWQLVSKHPTEDGVNAMFVRPKAAV